MADLAGRPVWVMAKGYAPDEGGMQTYAAGVATAYGGYGATVTVFTQTSRGPRRERQGKILLVDVGPGSGAATLVRLLRVMRQELARGTPHFVHGTTWRTSVLPLLLRLPYVTTFHGREFMGGSKIAAGIMRLVAQRARRIIAVSEYTAGKLRARLGPRLAAQVAHNGAGIAPAGMEADPPERDPPLIFSLCRLEPRKNIAACIEACAILRGKGRTFRYVIAGRGPELERLRTLVEDLGLADAIELAGYITDAQARAWYEQAAIFLHPQIEIAGGRDFEGFGIAIADAMVCANAVIVGRAGGAAELVEPGRSGLVVDGRDREELVAALDRLLLDKALRQSMAHAARERGRELFSWDRHVGIILDTLADQAPSAEHARAS